MYLDFDAMPQGLAIAVLIVLAVLVVLAATAAVFDHIDRSVEQQNTFLENDE